MTTINASFYSLAGFVLLSACPPYYGQQASRQMIDKDLTVVKSTLILLCHSRIGFCPLFHGWVVV
jgi:hypothetical protein